jgi:HlyD family secretion protein
MSRKLSIFIVFVVVFALLGFAAWTVLFKSSGGPPEGFARGNGRIEADLVDVSPRLAGRVATITVREGDLVAPGDVLAVMDTAELESRLNRANAAVASAEAAVGVMAAQVVEAEARLALARNEQARAETLGKRDMLSRQDLEIRRTETQVAEAITVAARANLQARQRSVDAEVAARAEIATRIADSTLYAQGLGRVLYRLAQPGEVLGSGGKLLTLLSLEQVYMEFFLPATEAPRVKIGDQARIVPDIMPNAALPATVTFVSPQAQFTPKQVETETERESLMFRIRVSIPPTLIAARVDQVKTGVRGVAWVRLARDDGSLPDWPQGLTPALVAVPDELPR